MLKAETTGADRRMTPRLFFAAAALAALAACAAPVPGTEPAFEGSINVFISPMGEPFRGGKDDAYPIDRWFARVDTDHDSALSWDEFKADATAFFRQLDLNHDGVIEGDEVSNYEQNVAPEILPRVARLTARDIPPLPARDPQTNRDREATNAATQDMAIRPRAGLLAGAAVFGVTPEPEPVAASDTDFDGKITLQEWLQSAHRRFDLLDLNHDGRVARAELPKTPAEKMAEKARRREADKSHRGQ